MKKLFYIIFLVLWGTNLWAQQRPQYALYFQNNYVLNPAITGIEDFTDAKLSYRKQWVGINGSPVTSYFSIQGPINDATKPHAGLGALIVGDKTGPDSRLTFNGSYAYHIHLSGELRASLGISAGVTQYTLNTNELNFDQYGGSYDPAVPLNRASQYIPDLMLGVWVYSQNFYVGGALNQIIPSKLSFGTNLTSNLEKLRPHTFITGGIKIPMGEDLNFTPSIMIKYISPAPVSYDFNGKFLYRDIFWLGGSIRRGDGFSLAAGINISTLINIGYAYDYTTSALQNYTSGSHEIILGLQLGNYNKARCPKMLW